jgi:hypothetical protein
MLTLPSRSSRSRDLIISSAIVIVTSFSTLAPTFLADRNLDTLASKALAQRSTLLDTRKLLGAPHCEDIREDAGENWDGIAGFVLRVFFAHELANVDEGEF